MHPTLTILSRASFRTNPSPSSVSSSSTRGSWLNWTTATCKHGRPTKVVMQRLQLLICRASSPSFGCWNVEPISYSIPGKVQFCWMWLRNHDCPLSMLLCQKLISTHTLLLDPAHTILVPYPQHILFYDLACSQRDVFDHVSPVTSILYHQESVLKSRNSHLPSCFVVWSPLQHRAEDVSWGLCAWPHLPELICVVSGKKMTDICKPQSIEPAAYRAEKNTQSKDSIVPL